MFPIHSGTAQTIANVFRKEILTRWVVPDILISDRGTEFCLRNIQRSVL